MTPAVRVNLNPASYSDATHTPGTIVGLEIGLEASCGAMGLLYEVCDPLSVVRVNALQKSGHWNTRRSPLLVDAEQIGQSPRHGDGLCGEVRFPDADIA